MLGRLPCITEVAWSTCFIVVSNVAVLLDCTLMFQSTTSNRMQRFILACKQWSVSNGWLGRVVRRQGPKPPEDTP